MQAFVRAEHIEAFKPAAFLSLVAATVITFIASVFGPISFVWLLVFQLGTCLLCLIAIVRWTDRFAFPAPHDEDFAIAFGKVRSAFWIWLAATLAQVIGLLTVFRTN